jgi:hypothetical protein
MRRTAARGLEARASRVEHSVTRLGAVRRKADHDTLAGVEDLVVEARDQLLEVGSRSYRRFSCP